MRLVTLLGVLLCATFVKGAPFGPRRVSQNTFGNPFVKGRTQGVTLMDKSLPFTYVGTTVREQAYGTVLISYYVEDSGDVLDDVWNPAEYAIEQGGPVGEVWKRNEPEFRRIQELYTGMATAIMSSFRAFAHRGKRWVQFVVGGIVMAGMMVLGQGNSNNADMSGVLRMQSNVAVDSLGVTKKDAAITNEKVSEINTKLTKLTNVVDENARATLTESRLRQEFAKGTAGIERLTSIYDAGVKGSVHYSAFDGLDLKDLADQLQQDIITRGLEDRVISSDRSDWMKAEAQIVPHPGFFDLKIFLPLASHTRELGIYRYNGNPIEVRQGQMVVPTGLRGKHLAVGLTHYTVLSEVDFLKCKSHIRNYVTCPESQLHNVVPDFDVTPVPRVDDGLCLLALFRADAARVRAWCDLEAVPLSAERDAAFFSGDGVFQVFSNETTLNVNVTCRGSTKAVNVKSGQSLKFDEGCTGSISGYSLGQDTFPSVINVTDGAAYATVVDWAEFERESFTNARNYKLMEELKAGGNNSVTDGMAVKQRGEAVELDQKQEKFNEDFDKVGESPPWLNPLFGTIGAVAFAGVVIAVAVIVYKCKPDGSDFCRRRKQPAQDRSLHARETEL